MVSWAIFVSMSPAEELRRGTVFDAPARFGATVLRAPSEQEQAGGTAYAEIP